jgi:hypothetical protein
MESVIVRLEAVQYDGTNGEFLASEFLSNTAVASDDGQELRLTDGTNDPLITVGDWVIRATISVGLYQFAGVYSDADYRARYAPLP